MEFNFLRVSVANEDTLKILIKEGICNSIKDCDFHVLQEFDYAEMALLDIDKKHIIYWDDNIHSNPKEYISAFIDGLKYGNVNYNLEDVVMMDSELYSEEYIGKKY